MACRPLLSRCTLRFSNLTGDKRSPTDKLVIRNNKLQHATIVKKRKRQWNILVPREIRYRDVSFSIVFLFHPSTPARNLDLSSLESVFQKVAFSECLILIWVISVDGRLIPREKMLFQRVEKVVCARRLKIHVEGAQCFTRRFEFPACAKLVRNTITFFSVCFFCFLWKSKMIWLVTLKTPFEKCFAHRNSKHNYTSRISIRLAVEFNIY